jgi:Bacterial Ig domain
VIRVAFCGRRILGRIFAEHFSVGKVNPFNSTQASASMKLPKSFKGFAKSMGFDGKRPVRRRQSNRQRSSFQPHFEQFEDRLVPTTLSIPTNLVAGRGAIVLVPVNVDILLDNSNPTLAPQQGLSGGDFVVHYDPSVLALDPATDIHLGTLGNPLVLGDGYSAANPNGWSIQAAHSPSPGTVIFGLVDSSAELVTGTGGGSLAVMNFHVLANAPLGGSMVDLAADTVAGNPPTTNIGDATDSKGGTQPYTLNPAPRDNTGALQTITFGGTVTGGDFTLAFNGATTSPITFSTSASALQTNIQGALNSLSTIGAGNSAVHANNDSSVTVTFTGSLGGAQTVPTMTAASSLSGIIPSITVSAVAPTGQPTFGYYGSDPDDGTVTVTGIPLPPVANNDAYSITERDFATEPGLTVAAPGVQANDASPQGEPLLSSLVSSPTHGSVTLFGNGSFIYTPNTGYLGADSFTYEDTSEVSGLVSNIATVNLTVTARLSIPTNLTGTQGATVTVPVNIDNPNPVGSGGLTGAALAIDYDSSVLQVANVLNGTVTSATSEVQTLTFGGFITGGTFTLALSATTAPITYSAVASTLQTNIQQALDTTFGAGNTMVSATSATNVTVAFQGTDANTFFNTFAIGNNLGGFNPTVAAAILTTGQAAWILNFTPSISGQPGRLGIAESSPNGQSSTIGGSIALIVFDVLPNAPSGPSDIFIVPSNTPQQVTVTTNLAYGALVSLPPRPALQPFPTFVTGVDGIVTISQTSGASHFVFNTPSSVTAGTTFSFTVFAEDTGNNIATNYAGTVAFTSSDGQAGLPGPVTLLNGTGVFSATLKTAGNQTLTATDSITASIHGASNPILVTAAAATHFVVSAPPAATAGTGFGFTVKAEDQFNNVATSYAGTVHFTTSDHGISTVLPANSGLTSGVGTFSATLTTTGNQTLSATDTTTSTITGQATVNVLATATDHFVLSAPGSVTAGSGFTFTVTVENNSNVIDTNYTGTVHFTSSDVGLSTLLPANGTLVAGVGTFSATLTTAGHQTLSGTDTVNPGITGSTAITVTAGTATHLVTTAPAAATAGTGFRFTVKAEDQFNNTATGYTGTVAFTSSDHGASTVLPGNSRLTSGVGTFSATLTTAGIQTLTATDTVTASLTGASGPITVSAATATHFAVTAPPAATAGVTISFTVTAEDRFNNTASGYSGTAVFTSSDAAAGFVPASSTLTSGVGTFHVTLKTAGTQTLTATDSATSSIKGASGPIIVSAAAVTHFGVTAPASASPGVGFSFTVTAEDQFNNTAPSYTGTVKFSTSDTAAGVSLPANSKLASGLGTFSATLQTQGNQTLSATDTIVPSITGFATIVVTTAQAASIVVLDPTACGALTISGNGSIDVPGAVVVDSKSPSALRATGNASVTASSIDVVGGVQTRGNATLNPAPTTHAPPVTDPLAGLPVPVVTGKASSVNLSDHSTLTIGPGIYSQIIVSGHADLTLKPGIYEIAGGGLDISGDGTVNGNGVVIYNAGSNNHNPCGNFGSITISGNGTFNVTAPAAGQPYAGILIFQARDNREPIILSGHATSTLSGTIYAADATLYLRGNSQLHSPLVVDRLNIAGKARETLPALGPVAAAIAPNLFAPDYSNLALTTSTIIAVSGGDSRHAGMGSPNGGFAAGQTTADGGQTLDGSAAVLDSHHTALTFLDDSDD